MRYPGSLIAAALHKRIQAELGKRGKPSATPGRLEPWKEFLLKWEGAIAGGLLVGAFLHVSLNTYVDARYHDMQRLEEALAYCRNQVEVIEEKQKHLQTCIRQWETMTSEADRKLAFNLSRLKSCTSRSSSWAPQQVVPNKTCELGYLPPALGLSHSRVSEDVERGQVAVEFWRQIADQCRDQVTGLVHQQHQAQHHLAMLTEWYERWSTLGMRKQVGAWEHPLGAHWHLSVNVWWPCWIPPLEVPFVCQPEEAEEGIWGQDDISWKTLQAVVMGTKEGDQEGQGASCQEKVQG